MSMMPVVLRSSAAALAGLDAEQVSDTRAPLVGQGLAVDEHEGRHAAGGDDCAGDDGLAGTGWRDQHAEVVTGQGVVRCVLVGIEARGEFEGLWLPIATGVGEVEVAAGLGDEIAEALEQAAGQDQVPGEGLVIAAQEPGCVPGGGAAALAFVEGWVGHRGCVLQGGQQRRRQVCAVDGDRRAEAGVHDRRGLH